MFNKMQIILDKGKSKDKIFIVYDMTDIIFILIGGSAGYYIGSFFDPVYQAVFIAGGAGIIAFLRFEFQNTFSIYEYLKLAYRYYFIDILNYIYYPISDNSREVKKEENEEVTERKIQHKKRKTKRKGKTAR